MKHYLHALIHLHNIRHNCKIYFHICSTCNTLAHCSTNITFNVEVYDRYFWSKMSTSASYPHIKTGRIMSQHLKVRFDIMNSSYTLYNLTTIVGN